jgi:hypothetical protein
MQVAEIYFPAAACHRPACRSDRPLDPFVWHTDKSVHGANRTIIRLARLPAARRSTGPDRNRSTMFLGAELHRARGVVMLVDHAGCNEPAAGLDRAVEVARRQNSRFLELGATVSKTRLGFDRGRRDGARAMSASVYQSFSEGPHNVDLCEAQALLDAI